VPGFRVEPRPSVQDSECGSTTWNKMMGDSDHAAVPDRLCNSVHVGNPYTSRKKGFSHSNIPQFGAVDLRRNGVDQNQPSDRPVVSSQSRDQEEVNKDTVVSS
jgi:hypothetical protein